MLIASENDVIRDAMKKNKKVRFARIFPICFEKGSELPEGDPDSLKGDASSKAMMLKTKIHMLLYFKSYRLRQRH